VRGKGESECRKLVEGRVVVIYGGVRFLFFSGSHNLEMEITRESSGGA
jgi:hypothetical protein